MATTVENLLLQHSFNPVNNLDFKSLTNKPWAAGYSSINNTKVYTVNQNGVVTAYLDGENARVW
jgi:hypothetical protein